MTVPLKKEFVSILSSMIMEILSDDEEDDVLPSIAIQEILAHEKLGLPSEKKSKVKVMKTNLMENRVLKETKYLQRTRFEKYEEPVIDVVPAEDMCYLTLKRRNDCFCPEHIDSKKKGEISVVVVQKGGGPGLSDSDFRNFWRMSRSTVEVICSLINPPEMETIVTHIELLTVLWHIGTNEPIEQVESRFEIPKAKIQHLESLVFERLCCLRPCLEKWPTGYALPIVKDGFKCFSGLGAIGAVGSVHFTCEKAPFNPKNFVNCLGNSTAVFHLVADHRGTFTRNSYFFWPGKRSPLPDSTILKSLPVSQNSFLLGGYEYCSSKKIIVPYWKGKLTANQQEFNIRHGECMKVLENAVLSLVSRFKILTSLRMTHSDYVRQLVTSCVLLHNLCTDLKDDIALDESLVPETFLPPAMPPKKETEYPLEKRRDEICADELCPDRRTRRKGIL